MNFNIVETHVFTMLDISLNIYFNFASLVDFLSPEISVWKFWPKIPLTLCTKLWGPVAPPKLFFNFFHILQVWFYYQNEQNEGVSRRKIPFLFLVNHPTAVCCVGMYHQSHEYTLLKTFCPIQSIFITSTLIEIKIYAKSMQRVTYFRFRFFNEVYTEIKCTTCSWWCILFCHTLVAWLGPKLCLSEFAFSWN